MQLNLLFGGVNWVFLHHLITQHVHCFCDLNLIAYIYLFLFIIFYSLSLVSIIEYSAPVTNIPKTYKKSIVWHLLNKVLHPSLLEKTMPTDHCELVVESEGYKQDGRLNSHSTT